MATERVATPRVAVPASVLPGATAVRRLAMTAIAPRLARVGPWLSPLLETIEWRPTEPLGQKVRLDVAPTGTLPEGGAIRVAAPVAHPKAPRLSFGEPSASPSLAASRHLTGRLQGVRPQSGASIEALGRAVVARVTAFTASALSAEAVLSGPVPTRPPAA